MPSVSGSSIIGIIISLIIICILIFNVIYISGVRSAIANGNSGVNLSKTGADVIFWTDIVLILLIGAYLIYNIVKIFTTPEQRAVLTKTLSTPADVLITPTTVTTAA